MSISFGLFVLLPALAGALFYLFLASDRYAAQAGFTVRGFESGGGVDMIGAFTGLAGSGSTTSDSYIVLEYLESRDVVEALQRDFDLQSVFGGPDKDWLHRLGTDPSAEDLLAYWQRRIATTFDATSGIITIEVEAFSPSAARDLADAVLGHTRRLVNRLSEDARADTLRFATHEVGRAEDRLRTALEAMRAFREREQSLDPSASAVVQIELLAELERELLAVRSRMAAFGDRINTDTPAMVSMRRQAETLEIQIAEKMATISASRTLADAPGALSGQLAAFEALEIEKTFAQQAYASALSSLEQARADADSQQRYLAVYTHPAVPQDAAYPRRILNAFLIGGAALCFWVISVLIVYAVRDHIA